MSHLRRFCRPLAVLALLASASVLVAAPTAAQEKVFVFANDMTNPDADSDGIDDQRWQVQVTVGTLGNCVPTKGDVGYSSPWLESGDRVGAALSLQECVFSIAAAVREASRTDCWYAAHLAWGDPGSGNLTYVEDSVLTSSTTRPASETRLSIVRKPGSACAVANRTHFVIRGTEVVDDLPGPSADPALTLLARRAAAVSEFDVRVEPDYPSGVAVPSGCDRSATFTVRGDGSKSSQVLQVTGAACRLRASVVNAPALFQVIGGVGAPFDAAAPNIVVDLTSLVRLVPARIAIIQDVQGSGNRGAVSYTITRSCGGVAMASPPAASTATGLYEGRFTVHSPDVPAFGPVAVYPAVAASATSSTIVSCSVSVTVGDVPANCVVDGPNTRTLTWTESNPVRHFDFEFDIGCGRATATTNTTQAPPPAATTQPPAAGPPPDEPTG